MLITVTLEPLPQEFLEPYPQKLLEPYSQVSRTPYPLFLEPHPQKLETLLFSLLEPPTQKF